MPLTRPQQQQVLDVLRQRVPQLRLCGLCQSPGLTLVDGIVQLNVQEDFPIGAFRTGRTLPSVALVCNQCGNTYLLSLVMLGLGHLAHGFGWEESAWKPAEPKLGLKEGWNPRETGLDPGWVPGKK